VRHFRLSRAALPALVLVVAGALAAPALANTAPSNTSPPTISGQANKGQTLTAASGTWDGTPPPTFAYQWLRCSSGGGSCSSISSATTQTYTLVSADVGKTIRVQVTATNAAGSSQVVSAQTAVVISATAPANTALPTLSGSPILATQLTVSNGTWSGTPAPTFKYQWQRCDANGNNCADINGATNQTYTLASADVGNKVLAIVTATNSAGTAAKSTAPSASVTAPPLSTVKPVVTGTAMVGQTLTTNAGTWTGSPTPTFGFQWGRCDTAGNNCTDIGGATSPTYTLTAADANHRLKARVTANNSAGSQSADSAVTAVIAAPVPPSVRALPRLSGTAVLGHTLNVSGGTWNGTQPIAISFRWQRCNTAGSVCLEIPGATSQAYGVGSGDLGFRLKAIVTATNSGGQASQATGSSSVVAVPTTTSVLAQRVVVLPGRGRIRLDLIQVRRPQTATLSLALDTWRDGGWLRVRTVRVANGQSQAVRLLLFRTRRSGASATVTIRWRLNATHVGFFSYAADPSSLRRSSRVIASQ
jgi:hypothetical protein